MNKKQAKEALAKLLEKYSLDPSAVWDCHGTPVLLHKACEQIAIVEGIHFERPAIVESSTKDGVVAVMVEGSLGEKREWSFGECSPKNNKNAYPYSMAEKRAKDRVILKLIGLSGYIYSEDEAEDFKKAKPEPQKEPEKASATPESSGRPLSVQVDERDRLDWTDILGERPLDVAVRNSAQSKTPYLELKKEMVEHTTASELALWAESRQSVIWSLSNEARHHLREAYDTQLEKGEA